MIGKYKTPFLICVFIILSSSGTFSANNVPPNAEERLFDEATTTKKYDNLVKCTYKGQEGYCYPSRMCDDAHIFMRGGVIDDGHGGTLLRILKSGTSSSNSDLKESKGCQLKEWCCIDPKKNEQTRQMPKNTCSSVVSSTCEWCVTLHKGKKYNSFCMGSMIGPKTVLTASTCIKASRNRPIWARVPSSADPHKNYTVSKTIVHPKYVSGSHANDFGILVLEENVKWNSNNWIGACLGIHMELEGDCLVLSTNQNGVINATIVTVKPSSCDHKGNASDAACGDLYKDLETCDVTTGSPVICPIGVDTAAIAGVARNFCDNKKVLLGKFPPSALWLTTALEENGVKSEYYTY